MQDWAERIDKFLLADDRIILQGAGTISAELAKDHTEQDKLYRSDFNRIMEERGTGIPPLTPKKQTY